MTTASSFTFTLTIIVLSLRDSQTTLYYEERCHVSWVTGSTESEIMSPSIKRVMISQVRLITNSRLCAFISNAVTLNAVTSSLIWGAQMIDQSMVQWSIPGPELALNRSSHYSCREFMRVWGQRTLSGLSHLFNRF